MKLPKKAWLDMSKGNGQWRLLTPNTKLLPFTRFYSGCMQQPLSVQVETAANIKVKNTQRIHLDSIDEQSIRIGPLIGILSVDKNDRLLGNRSNFIDIIKTGRQLGALVFVFTPNDIDWEKMQINGRFYHFLRKQWIKQPVPFPDVIYNRIPNRQYEAAPEMSNTLQKLQMIPNLHLFNPRFFNKWELYEIIQTSHMHQHLPESRLLTSPQVLAELLQKYKKLFLKPSAGKAGNGIYLLTREEGAIHLSSSFDGEKKKIQSTRVEELWQRLQTKVGIQPYIVQQAIPLLAHGGSPFDVRVLVQKNIHGEWSVSGVGYRVAGKDSVTTHVPQGGKIIDRALALDAHFGTNKSEQILQSIHDFAIHIAQALEPHYQLLGEMSMDLGLTAEGRLWFFEANAKPMKFDEPEIRKTSLRRIIEYSMYLSRFT